MEGEMLELIWTNHGPIFRYFFTEHREKERYTDATIGCEGKLYAVHKLVLATCSQYFDEVFEHTEGKHPVLLLHDVKQHELEAILCYMYTGSANVSQLNLTRFMMVAKALQIKGLAVPDGDSSDPLSGIENSQVGRNKTPLTGNYCWSPDTRQQDTRRPDTQESTKFMTNSFDSQSSTNIRDQNPERFVVEKPPEQIQMKNDTANESSINQYSFQGFNYKNVEGPDDEDLIKKREVLEKIISQTEGQFIKDDSKIKKETHEDPTPENETATNVRPVNNSEKDVQSLSDSDKNVRSVNDSEKDVLVSKDSEKNVRYVNDSRSKRPNDDMEIAEPDKVLKKDKESIPSSSSKSIKSNTKQNLNMQKKTTIAKLQASKEYQARKKKHILAQRVAKPFKCSQCLVSFSRKYHLHRHMRTHVEAPHFACTFCHAKFPKKEFLTTHMETHDKSKPYICTFCNSSFSRKDKLTVHIKNHHTEGKSNVASHVKNSSSKQYTCSECPDTFDSHDQYVEHSKMHAGEKQFPCTVCPAAFAKKVHLSRHVLSHKGFGSRDKL